MKILFAVGEQIPRARTRPADSSASIDVNGSAVTHSIEA
jgi:hypothetical protein